MTLLLLYLMITSKIQTYTLDILCSLADLSRRTIRYYIQIGLIEGPQGAGRGAYYTQIHLEKLIEIRKWQNAGLSLERIQELLKSDPEETIPLRKKGTLEVWSHLLIDQGIELHLEPSLSGLSSEGVRELAQKILESYEEIRKRGESQ
jgi:DNA-binding transcriptional MerR regulator